MARALLLTAVAACLVALVASPARAGNGGGGLGTPPPAHRSRPHRSAAPRAAHRRPAHPRSHGRPFALHGRAMWIWELADTDHGNLADIILGARQERITTVVVKSGDGIHRWPQFSRGLVATLHRAGLRVCAWQYVYGTRPGDEANVGADAVRDGADCLVIDAEVQYQGRYVAAQSYLHDLRRQIGARYPVALAGFPYVQFHPSFPYSVFLGPGGAQYDVPQMYWRAIRTSVDKVFAQTYAFNLPYDRPIYPLGQVYANPPPRQVVRFRELAAEHGAGGVSWWDWQSADDSGWRALAAPVSPRRSRAAAPIPMAAVGEGAEGDLVVWLQEHLLAAGQPIPVSGDFGYHTLLAVESFQTAHGLVADGVVGPETWAALLRYRPVVVHWVHRGRRTVAAEAIAAAAGAATRRVGGSTTRRPGTITLPVPASAALPARRDEIPGALGAGPGPTLSR